MAAAAAAPQDEAAATSNQSQLNAQASRLLKSAQRASEAAKHAYSAGIEGTQVRMRQVSDAVLENSQRAKESSTDFLSKVHDKATHYAGLAQEKAGHYAGRAQAKASEHKGDVSRAIQQSRDGEGEKVGFPLNVLVWCSTLCGGSKKKDADTSAEREWVPESSAEGREGYSSGFLASTADEYAAALDEAAEKLEQEVAEKEKKNASGKA